MRKKMQAIVISCFSHRTADRPTNHADHKVATQNEILLSWFVHKAKIYNPKERKGGECSMPVVP